MAITNYAELRQAITNYTHRADLAGVIPDFIALAHARFNRILRTSEMECRSTATVNTEYVSLPDNFLALRNIQLNGSSRIVLQYMTPQQIDEQYRGRTGTPCYFSIINQQFQFAPIPDGDNTVEIDFYERIPELSDTNTTNWLLTAHPDAYLYGSLLQTEAYGYKDNRLPIWKQAYDEAIGEIMANDENKRWSGSALIGMARNVV